jgi:hypothetical protein
MNYFIIYSIIGLICAITIMGCCIKYGGLLNPQEYKIGDALIALICGIFWPLILIMMIAAALGWLFATIGALFSKVISILKIYLQRFCNITLFRKIN